MITLTAKSEGTQGGQYIARLVGRHKSYTFEREFVGRKMGNRHERTEADLDTIGLYEVCDVDRHGKSQRYVFVLDAGHRLAAFDCEKREAMTVARLLDDGMVFSQLVRATEDGIGYEVLTAAQAKREQRRADIARSIEVDALSFVCEVSSEQRRADIARSIETASEECWAILQALPLREARRVVAALKKRLTPQEPSVAEE